MIGRAATALEALRTRTFDVAVVGGGVHGAWIAWRATQAGLSVALVERDDFAAGTSANSLRILHGGLRYLQHLDLARMRESVRARREYARCVPEHVRALGCVMPLAMNGVRSPWVLGPALLVNDLVACDRNRGVAAAVRLPRGRVLDGRAARSVLEPLVESRARSAALWWDAVTTDPARLALAPLLSAERAGATIANRVRAERLRVASGRACGVDCVDLRDGAHVGIAAHAVVDATGPGAGALGRSAGLDARYLPAAWIAGLNVGFAPTLTLEHAVALRAVSRGAARDGVLVRAARELFFVPVRGGTFVGTDYRRYRAVAEAPAVAPQDAIDDFVAEIARVAPAAGFTSERVACAHWGLMPAGPDGLLPARAPIVAAGEAAGAHGLVVVIGEKLTSAPVLSMRAVQLVLGQIGEARRPGAADARVTLERAGRAGSPRGPAREFDDGSDCTAPHAIARLRARYGERWRTVLRHARSCAAPFEPLAADCDALRIEVVHALEDEWACTVDDVALRRLGLGGLQAPGARVRAAIAALGAREGAAVGAATGSAQAAAFRVGSR